MLMVEYSNIGTFKQWQLMFEYPSAAVGANRLVRLSDSRIFHLGFFAATFKGSGKIGLTSVVFPAIVVDVFPVRFELQ